MLTLQHRQEAGSLQPARLRGRAAVDVDLDLLLFLPAAPMPPNGFPTLLYLHGRGERATLDAVASFGPPKLARSTPDFPWAIVAPRCPPGRGWETGELVAILDHLLEALPLDAARVVATGVSMGGFATWALLLSHPERLAGAVPVCGGAPFAVPSLLPADQLERIKAVPVRAYHGADDDVVLPSESITITEELRALGCDVTLTIYPGVGHDAWTPAYADPQLWSWLADSGRV